ncbi:MAG: FG-GAP-like repeat-containing protein, partial [Candidatus Promineifilaceae bacterium]
SDNILYVLLIGDPDPDDPKIDGDKVGDMPMKMFKGYPPTDYYFSDLDNQGSNFPDWGPEVFVGRIPLYYEHSDWRYTVDDVLNKTIVYEEDSNVGWRRSALLAMAFLDQTSDGARLAEFMRDDYLLDRGFDTHRLYWHGALSNSRFPSEEELIDGGVRARWAAESFGVVAFYGHGSAVLQGIYEEYDIGGGMSGLGAIFESREAPYLDDSKPAMVLQIGCQTGTPEKTDNMGFSLLKNGAVTTIAGSRDTYGFPDSAPGTGTGNMSLFYNHLNYLSAGEPVGQSLAWVRTNASGRDWNGLAYNLYGDPSLTLFGTANVSSAQDLPGDTAVVARSEPAAIARDAIIPPPAAEPSAAQGNRPSRLAPANDSDPGQLLTGPPDELVSMGPFHVCAIQPDGRVDCQGDDWGNGEFWPLAADRTGLYQQVSAGEFYTCGLLKDGSVHCWGMNEWGPVEDQDGPFSQIAAGGTHACGLQEDGSVSCWGDNSFGQGTPPSGAFTAVTAGAFHTCGLRSNGAVDCWGANEFGESDSRTGPYVALASGGYHNCGLKANGGIECWGDNTAGQAGQRPGPFVQVAAGRQHTCGLLASGEFRCWGAYKPDKKNIPSGTFSALSAGGAFTCGLEPDGVSCWSTEPGKKFGGQYDAYSAVSAGQDHVCALKVDGTIRCWGGNEFGQADSQLSLDPFKQVSAGIYANCGLRTDGSVSCWGRPMNPPLDHPGPFVQFSSSYHHACGLRDNGSVECWGDNSAGQAPEYAGSGFVQISSGLQHTCGLDDYGGVTCWGRNSFGQANNRPGPFKQIASGFFHTCGLTFDGDIDCWGANQHGQAVDQEGPFIQVAVGWFNSCGLRQDFSVHCWGKNQYGQTVDMPGPYLRVSTGLYQTVGLKPDGTLEFWAKREDNKGGWMRTEEQPGPFGQYEPPSRRMTFEGVPYGFGAHYTAVRLADMDGDGALELLIGNRETPALEIWRYDQALAELVFVSAIPFPAQIHDIAAADLDGDKDMDIVAGLRGEGLYVATNNGAGADPQWTLKKINGKYALQVLVADFDDDGFLDIFEGIDYGPILTYYGSGDGTFVAGAPVEPASTKMRLPRGFNAVDADKDGLLDLLGSDGSYLRTFKNPGDRSAPWNPIMWEHTIGSYPCCDGTAFSAGLAPSAGDFDHNGYVDLVAFWGTIGRPGPVKLLLFTGDHDEQYGDTYWLQSTVDTLLYPGWAGHAGVADIDGDGNLDIHFGGWNVFDGLHLYYGDGKGGFTHEMVDLNYGVGEPNSFAAGDITGDGVTDFVTNCTTLADGSACGFDLLTGKLNPKEPEKRFNFLPLALAAGG